MTTSGEVETLIRDALQDGLRSVRERGGSVNEAVTRAVLIDRVLDALGYPPVNRTPEDIGLANRADYTCFQQRVTANPGKAALIVEAKTVGTNFDSAAGQQRTASPDRQIQRYLKQHPASGVNTRGVLTDGLRWRIYRRTASPTAPDIIGPEAFDFRPMAEPGAAPALWGQPAPDERLAQFIKLLAPGLLPAERAARPTGDYADPLFAAIAQTSDPPSIVRRMLDDAEATLSVKQESPLALTGVRRDAHDNDWEDYAYAQGAGLQSAQAPLLGDPAFAEQRIIVAAVKFRYNPEADLSRGEVALGTRVFAEAGPAKAALLFAYAVAPDGGLQARMAVCAAGQVNMTVPFDPGLPSPSARAAADQLLRLLRQPAPIAHPDRVLEPLAAAPLRQQFYREIDQWTRRRQRGGNAAGRQAVLRHLIRVMFAWILKENERIPPELFEQGFIQDHLPNPNDYHRVVLRFLFHQRLNVDREFRDPHPDAPESISQALDGAPFLNGSLFREEPDSDRELDVPADAYWNSDDRRPGLFTIFSRYHWTMDEHRPGESEQTLDPELLSNLFERLIAPTQQGGEAPLRQPQGTYYTPADVSDEMVKDALTAAVKDAAGLLSETQLLALFGQPEPEPLPLSVAEKRRLAARIKELRIFDPAVGSGEFLLSMLLALQRALRRLDATGDDCTAEAIIRRQLAGQDINPLAVQIARLRLYIAITAGRREQLTLPNLEAIIVCADTLATVADPQWRTAQLDQSNPTVGAAVQAIIANRREWFAAHYEDAKQEILTRDGALRAELRHLLDAQGALASPELQRLTEVDLMARQPHQTDARLLFPPSGFDIVIGNPPYEALAKSKSAAARKRLTTDKNYQTVNVGDLYTLFCEAALALAKPDGGVVTLVVPLSISFGQSQRKLREIFNARCREINLRHYDNIPDTIFNGSPTLKTWKNRQRTTIVVALLGDSAVAKRETPIIKSTGLQGWPVAERELCLAQRPKTILNPIAGNIDQRISQQWLRIATPEVAELITAILDQSRTVSSYRYVPDADDSPDGEFLSFPHTAYQFLGVIPANSVSPRRENLFRVKDNDDLRLLMATLNGHVGYAWWWTVGDGFHIKAIADLEILRIPNIYSKNPDVAINMGQRLIDAIPECTTEKKNSGTVWKNVNFHLKPELIEELDRLHLAALGLPAEPLLRQLRMMRSSSSWNYAAA